MKTKKLLFIILQGIFSLFVILTNVFSGFYFSSFNFSHQNAELSMIKEVSSQKKSDLFSSTFSFNSDDNRDYNEKYFATYYPVNFSNSSTTLLFLSVSRSDDSIATFNFGFDDLSFNYRTSIISGLTYTNREDKVMFETLPINLYRYQPKSVELSYNDDVYNGFVYIPDFYADYIISNSSLTSYDDLLDHVNEHTFTITCGKTVFKYKIANIFHVDGFNEEYTQGEHTYIDDNKGEFIKKIFGNYCLVSNYSALINEEVGLRLSVTNVSKNKQYIIDEYLSSIAGFSSRNSCSISGGRIRLIIGNDSIIYPRTKELIGVYVGNNLVINHFWLIPLIFCALMVVGCAVAVFLLYKNNAVSLSFFLQMMTGIVFLFVGYILKKLLPLSLGVFLFFNAYTFGICIVFLMVFLSISIATFSLKGRAK